MAAAAGWLAGGGSGGSGLATPRNGMLLTVSIPLPTPSVGKPVEDCVSVVRLRVMVPRMFWPTMASRKTELGSSTKFWKLGGNGPVLCEVGAIVSSPMLISGTTCSLPSGAMG